MKNETGKRISEKEKDFLKRQKNVGKSQAENIFSRKSFTKASFSKIPARE